MEQRTNVGYVITGSVHIGDTEFVIGQSENDPARFVTWACDNGDYYYSLRRKIGADLPLY